MGAIILNVAESKDMIKISFSTKSSLDDTTEKIMTLALPKNILKHMSLFDTRLKGLLESHVKANERMESIDTKRGGKKYTINKQQFKNALAEEDVDRLARWIVDSFVKTKYKPGIDAYVIRKIDTH